MNNPFLKIAGTIEAFETAKDEGERRTILFFSFLVTTSLFCAFLASFLFGKVNNIPLLGAVMGLIVTGIIFFLDSSLFKVNNLLWIFLRIVFLLATSYFTSVVFGTYFANQAVTDRITQEHSSQNQPMKEELFKIEQKYNKITAGIMKEKLDDIRANPKNEASINQVYNERLANNEAEKQREVELTEGKLGVVKANYSPLNKILTFIEMPKDLKLNLYWLFFALEIAPLFIHSIFSINRKVSGA